MTVTIPAQAPAPSAPAGLACGCGPPACCAWRSGTAPSSGACRCSSSCSSTTRTGRRRAIRAVAAALDRGAEQVLAGHGDLRRRVLGLGRVARGPPQRRRPAGDHRPPGLDPAAVLAGGHGVLGGGGVPGRRDRALRADRAAGHLGRPAHRARRRRRRRAGHGLRGRVHPGRAVPRPVHRPDRRGRPDDHHAVRVPAGGRGQRRHRRDRRAVTGRRRAAGNDWGLFYPVSIGVPIVQDSVLCRGRAGRRRPARTVPAHRRRRLAGSAVGGGRRGRATADDRRVGRSRSASALAVAAFALAGTANVSDPTSTHPDPRARRRAGGQQADPVYPGVLRGRRPSGLPAPGLPRATCARSPPRWPRSPSSPGCRARRSAPPRCPGPGAAVGRRSQGNGDGQVARAGSTSSP